MEVTCKAYTVAVQHELPENVLAQSWGQGVGLQGQSYAIPTMQGGVKTIKPYVDEFIKFAQIHTEFHFLGNKDWLWHCRL